MNKKNILTQKQIENQIYLIRGVQVILDSDLAEIYMVETRVLNQAVKRNIKRFPKDFMFQLTEIEWMNLQSQIMTINISSKKEIEKNKTLISQNVISSSHGGRRKLPFVFTEHGVASLSGILKSEIAIKVNIAIMRAFVAMRKLNIENQLIHYRLQNIELKQNDFEHKFDLVFTALECSDKIPSQGVFFDGQVFDAYELISRIIRSAKINIVLIDNYINESSITHLSKKKKDVKVLLLTKVINNTLMLDVKKANEQYGNFQLKAFTKSHDRFLIIDNKEIYHLGASLKDIGKKWFAFSRMNKKSVENIINEISILIKHT